MSPELSVVIPLLDESPNVDELYRELTETLDAWGRTYEMVFVDDGSTDGTFERLAGLQASDPRMRVVSDNCLRRAVETEACKNQFIVPTPGRNR